MLAKKQKAREVIQTALAAQKIYARPAIASEAQAAFDEQKSHNYRSNCRIGKYGHSERLKLSDTCFFCEFEDSRRIWSIICDRG
jgi:hypothetical protein